MTSPPVCNYEGSDYQTSFWDQGGRAYEDAAEAIALKHLLPKSGNLMLEIGAGAGRNTPRYAGFEKIVLLDYSRTQLEQAQARLGRSDKYVYVAADAYRLPFVDGLFDGATMIRTLHHMADASKALVQVARVLQSNSIFILEFANKQNFKAILRWLLRRQDWSPFTREPVEFAALNFDFHPRAVFDWLTEAGFSIEAKRTVSHFRLGLLKRLVPFRWLAALDGFIQPTGEWWQLTPSVFVRAKRVGRNAIPPYNGVVFRCPECGTSPLVQKEAEIECPSCERRYEVRDGIYDFRQPI
ncbi:MAG: methyltransferase domain-containing protein [Anaerolineaceae bacterium]|nr:MAG: methyltransferase domain-containing protein [Anaerolineaceae bacterium]